MLEVKGITKKFGGLTANEDISFTQPEGEIMGIIGPNGCGKTTMFNIISGVMSPFSGEVHFYGENITSQKPHIVVQKGISRTFQLTSILPEETVEENVFYGLFSRIDASFVSSIIQGKKYKQKEAESWDRVEEVLEILRLTHNRKEVAARIPPAEQRKLMIAIALARNPKLLLLDEPAAGTSMEEQLQLIEILKEIRSKGVSILVIEHNMRLVMNLCEHIVALNFGKKIGDGTPSEIQENPAVIEAYLGEAVEA